MNTSGSVIIPALRYQDAPQAIEWLCKTFGFKEHLVVPGEDGSIAHAQLTLGNSMIMLGSQREGDYDTNMRLPAQVGGHNTQAPYIVIEAIEDHYQQAVAAGADITMELEDQDYGGKLYTCRDPEGHIWSFGSYNPWAD